MKSITVKNIPGRLHQTLKQRAIMAHRSLNNEIIASLEAVTGLAPLNVNQMAFDATLMQKAFKGEASAEEIDLFKKDGRA